MPDEPVHKWRIETNDRYNKIVSSVISLATAALIVPALLLREFLGVPKEKALVPFLTCAAYTAWVCLLLSILLGLFYSWVSVKWVKFAWGQTISVSERVLECALNVLFVLMGLLFLVGVAATVWFFVTLHVG